MLCSGPALAVLEPLVKFEVFIRKKWSLHIECFSLNSAFILQYILQNQKKIAMVFFFCQYRAALLLNLSVKGLFLYMRHAEYSVFDEMSLFLAYFS